MSQTRPGLIARKTHMTQIFADDGARIPITVLRLEQCQIVGLRNRERDGYSAVQVGAGAAKAKNTPKPQRQWLEKNSIAPKRVIAEFRLKQDGDLKVGGEFAASHFVEGQFVDATAMSIGKGFAGAMKRHNFGGLRASHGVSISHRSHGSTGQCQDPGRVFKGKKMAGHMGAVRRTIQSLEIIRTDDEEGVILLKGSVPGAKGGWVMLKDAAKRPLPKEAPLPAGLLGGAQEDDAPEAETEEQAS